MNAPQHFETGDGYARFTPVGQFTLKQAIELIASAIQFAAGQHIGRLLVNAVGLEGFGPPGTFDRYYFAKEFAASANPSMKIAFVFQAQLIDVQKFGVLVAANRGLNSNVFSDEEDAL